MTINYDYYRIFYVVAQCRSFTRAAELLKNNQPNITRCMKNLEQELGCKLFHRSNKGITLTPRGPAVLPAGGGGGGAAAAGRGGDPPGRQPGERVAVDQRQRGGLHMILLDKLSIFRAQYPGVHLRITNETTPQASSGCGMGRATLPSSPRRCPPAAPCSRPSCCALPRYRCAARPTATWPPPVHHGRTGKLPPGLPGGGHQYIPLFTRAFSTATASPSG